MSTEALKWVIELSPPFPAHLFGTLAGLAYHADKKGRHAFPSEPRLAAYACKTERSIRRDLRELEKLALIRPGDPSMVAHIPADRRPAIYDLAVEQVVPRGRAGDDEGTSASARALLASRERGRAAREEKARSQTQEPESDRTSTSGGTPTSGRNDRLLESTSSEHMRADADVRADVDDRADVHVRDGRTSTSQREDVHVRLTNTYEPTAEEVLKDTLFESEPAAAAQRPVLVAAVAVRTESAHPTFDDFWDAYPKHRDKQAALKAWATAIKAGVDPTRIVRAAAAYADERRGQDAKYTKYPTTWLNKGCWDDEPDVRPGPRLAAVAGDWHPYQNPADPNAYDGDL
ncbi:helix-turn-helix domain-containing protein [Embleya sp. NPDC001921]